jgi:hypothetical protein
MMSPCATIEIDDVIAGTYSAVCVLIRATGKLAWLPRNCTEIWPGLVIVPEWLAKKIGAPANG